MDIFKHYLLIITLFLGGEYNFSCLTFLVYIDVEFGSKKKRGLHTLRGNKSQYINYNRVKIV